MAIPEPQCNQAKADHTITDPQVPLPLLAND